VKLRDEGLCAALNLRESILCGDKLIGSKLYRQWNFTRCEIFLSNMRAAARNFTLQWIWQGTYFLRRAQYVVKF